MKLINIIQQIQFINDKSRCNQIIIPFKEKETLPSHEWARKSKKITCQRPTTNKTVQQKCEEHKGRNQMSLGT